MDAILSSITRDVRNGDFKGLLTTIVNTISTYPGTIVAILVLIRILQQILTSRNPIPETSGKVYKPANATEFDTLLSTTKHVVVDFYADWCPPCRAIAPVFSELADKHSAEGRLAFAKVNVDHVHDIATRYGVSAMPTFVFFEGGKLRGVKVEGGLGGRGSVVVNGEGLVERVRGADRAALVAVVEALAGKGVEGGKKEE